MFSALRFLPDPLLSKDGHYLPFSDVFGKTTTEKDRLSLKTKKQKSLSYSPSKQHATNVGVVIQCEECNKWLLMCSKISNKSFRRLLAICRIHVVWTTRVLKMRGNTLPLLL